LCRFQILRFNNQTLTGVMANQQRPTLSREQIIQYFERLGLPEQQHVYDVAALEPAAALKYLALLQKLHLVAIPFENLT
jgi:hypothetical protein